MENGWSMNPKNPMLNNKNAFHIKKGLLLTVVLFCFFACKSSSSESMPTNTNLSWDTTMPNPSRYLLFGNGKKNSTEVDSLTLEELNLLQDGDILLRKGFGSISEFIADFLAEKYAVTHCGLVLNSKEDSIQILHTISNESINNVHIEPLQQYVKQSAKGSLVLVRLKCSLEKKKAILQAAKRLLKKKIPFDMGFNDLDDQSLYCIELLRDIFLEVFEQDLLPKRTHKNTIDVLSMDNFFNPLYFEVLFNHFDSIPITNKSLEH